MSASPVRSAAPWSPTATGSAFGPSTWRCGGRRWRDAEGWDLVPPIARIVDRGDPFQRPSDIGAMELYATPIVGSDPYELIDALR